MSATAPPFLRIGSRRFLPFRSSAKTNAVERCGYTANTAPCYQNDNAMDTHSISGRWLNKRATRALTLFLGSTERRKTAGMFANCLLIFAEIPLARYAVLSSYGTMNSPWWIKRASLILYVNAKCSPFKTTYEMLHETRGFISPLP